MIAEDTTVRLGEVFSTKTGGTPPKSDADLYGRHMPFVKPPELTNSLIQETSDGLSESGAAVARTAPAGSTLVSCIGVLGKVGITDRTVAFNQQVNAILPDCEIAIPKFVFYQALSPAFQRQLNELATGTTVPIVNKSKFNSIQIFLPPLDEQRRIVSTLDRATTGVEESLALKQAARRLTNVALGRSIDLVLDQHSKNGELIELSELAQSITDGDHGTPPKADSGVPFITIASIDQDANTIKLDGTRFVPQDYFDGLSETRKPRMGDLVLTTNGTLGVPAVVAEDVEFSFQRDISLIRPLDGVDPYWLSYSIRSSRCQGEISRVARGAAQQHLYLGELRKLRVPRPDQSVQGDVVKQLREIDDQFEKLREVQEDAISSCLDLRKSTIASLVRGPSLAKC